jgi:TolB-like protein
MKHLLKKMGVLPFLVIMLAGCGSSPTKAETVSGQGISVDTAVQQAARNIENNIEAGQKVVVLNFSSSSEDFSEYVLGELSTELVNGRKLQVVDRRNLEAIRAEMDFQMSGEVSDESAQAIGRKLGAEYIISGSLTNTGGIYRFRINTINVESAGIAASSATDIANDGKVQALLASGGGAGSGVYSGTQTAQRVNTGGSTTPSAAQAPAAQPSPDPAPEEPAKVYKIGDTGPAGGIVFYDKFSSTGGWRYLEAAPAETEQMFPWGDVSGAVYTTSPALGDGKRNTQIIVDVLQRNKIGGAAQYCNDLEYGGYTDWFLPGRDELDLMYRNLKEKGLGGFQSSSYYWSSSHGSSGYSWCQNFSNGEQHNRGRGDSRYVRAVRQF